MAIGNHKSAGAVPFAQDLRHGGDLLEENATDTEFTDGLDIADY